MSTDSTPDPSALAPDPGVTLEQRPLPWRLGCMADAMVSAKLGPRQRFFSRERVDEIVLLLREAEKALLDVQQERRAAELLAKFGEATGASPWT